MKKKRIALYALLICMALMLCACAAGKDTVSYDYTAVEVLDAIKKAYGEDYLPDTEITSDMLTDVYGIDFENVLEIKAEMPMIGFHPDRVIVIKAKEGKGADMEAALKASLESVRAEAAWYPANMAKANAATVVRNGDYTALIMLGAVDETSASEADAKMFAEAETKKGVDAFNALFGE